MTLLQRVLDDCEARDDDANRRSGKPPLMALPAQRQNQAAIDLPPQHDEPSLECATMTPDRHSSAAAERMR
jgi:hypothetical protein